jgi:hypothetical protein
MEAQRTPDPYRNLRKWRARWAEKSSGNSSDDPGSAR